MNRSERVLLALCAVAVLPAVLNLNGGIWEGDPAQYAEVARRMARSGDWWHLYDNFGPFLNKPPLPLWAQALCVSVMGPTSVAARLPTLLFGVVLMIAIARIGALLWSREVGFSAAALMAGSLAFQLMVADPKVDMAVTAMIACTVWLALEARRRRWMIWLAWVFAGLAFYCKGPIGLAAPVAAVFPEAIRREWGTGERKPLWLRVWRMQPLGLFVVAAMLAPFLRALYEEFGAHGPRFFLFGQSFGRILRQSEFKNSTTPLFFLHTALWAFLPFVPVLIVEIARGARRLWRERSLPYDESRVLWWWLWIPLLAISFSQFKLPQYLYWLAPPAALISARALSREVPRALGFAWVAIACLGAGGIALALWAFPAGGALTAAWLVGAGLVAACALVVARRFEGLARWTVLAIGSVFAAELFYQTYLHPTLDAYQPGPEWARAAREADPSAKYVAFRGASASNAFAYYADAPAIEGATWDLIDAVRRGEVKVAICEPEHVNEITATGLQVEPIAERTLFPVSLPTRAFLNPATRATVVTKQQLLRLRLPP